MDALTYGSTSKSIGGLQSKLKGEFLKRLLAGEVAKIKLIGDSITVSVTVTGFAYGNSRLILNRSGNKYEVITSATTFPSWGNLFRKYVADVSPTTDFFNAGVGGISTNEVANTYLSTLITDTEDVIVLMLGMNDRQRTFAQYEADMRKIIEYAKTRSKTIILMSYPPSLSEYTNYDPAQGLAAGYNFGSREIHQKLSQLADEYSLIFIPHFVKSMEYASKANVPYRTVVDLNLGINNDYTHPSNLGDRVIWETMQDELGFVSDPLEWDKGYNKVIVASTYNRITMATELSSTLFRDGCIHQDFLTTAVNPYGVTPENQSCVVTTYKPYVSLAAWGYQDFVVYQTGRKYMRTWNGSAWGELQRVGGYFTCSTTTRQQWPSVGLTNGDVFHETTSPYRDVKLLAKGVAEEDTLTLTHGATSSGNIRINLNSSDYDVAVAAGDTIAQVEAKIRATAALAAAWQIKTQVTPGVISFKKLRAHVIANPTFTDVGSTGVTASFAVTTAGTAHSWADLSGTGVT